MAMSGALTSSPLLRELLMHIKKAIPEAMSAIIPKVIDTLMRMPPEVVDVSPDDFGDLQEQLTKTRAEDDAQSGKKRSKAQISKKHAANSQLATKLHDLLRTYFDKALCGYQQVFLHEMLFYDLKAPHREAFMPRPRFAVERALSSPHDYLGCSCCAHEVSLSCETHWRNMLIFIQLGGSERHPTGYSHLIPAVSGVWKPHKRIRPVVCFPDDSRRSLRERKGDICAVLPRSCRIEEHGLREAE